MRSFFKASSKTKVSYFSKFLSARVSFRMSNWVGEGIMSEKLWMFGLKTNVFEIGERGPKSTIRVISYSFDPSMINSSVYHLCFLLLLLSFGFYWASNL